MLNVKLMHEIWTTKEFYQHLGVNRPKLAIYMRKDTYNDLLNECQKFALYESKIEVKERCRKFAGLDIFVVSSEEHPAYAVVPLDKDILKTKIGMI